MVSLMLILELTLRFGDIHQPPAWCFRMKSLQAVFKSLSQSTFQPALFLLQVWVHRASFSWWTHTPVSQASPPQLVSLWSRQITTHWSTNYWPKARAPALGESPMAHEVLNPLPTAPPSLLWSIQFLSEDSVFAPTMNWSLPYVDN